MGFSAEATLVATKVTVLVAPAYTALTDYKTLNPFSPTGAWLALGHLSDKKNVKMAHTGGELKKLGSSMTPSLRNSKAPSFFDLSLTALQFDKNVFDVAFNGQNNTAADEYVISAGSDLAKRAVIIYVHDGSGVNTIWYMADVDLTVGAMPEFVLNEYSEIEILGSVLDEPDGSTVKVYKGSFGPDAVPAP